MAYSVSPLTRVAVLLTLVVVVIVLLLANAVGAQGPDTSVYAEHRVASGDTLWDIAAGYTAAGDDVRNTIVDIRRANDLDGSVIVPGQVLRIPVRG